MLFFTGWVRNSVAWVIGKVFKDEKLAGTMRAASCRSVHEFHKLVQQRDEFSRMFYREVGVVAPYEMRVHMGGQVWDKHGLDGIVAPVLALPALPHGYVQRSLSPTSAFPARLLLTPPVS